MLRLLIWQLRMRPRTVVGVMQARRWWQLRAEGSSPLAVAHMAILRLKEQRRRRPRERVRSSARTDSRPPGCSSILDRTSDGWSWIAARCCWCWTRWWPGGWCRPPTLRTGRAPAR